jgi:hypothetical protein
MRTPQERRFRRFNFTHPVHVKFPSGDSMAEVDGTTRNIGIGGLLLESAYLIPYLSPVEFTITLTGLPMKLGGTGRVVRIEAGETTERFKIAVACGEPMYEIVGRLRATIGQ